MTDNILVRHQYSAVAMQRLRGDRLSAVSAILFIIVSSDSLATYFLRTSSFGLSALLLLIGLGFFLIFNLRRLVFFDHVSAVSLLIFWVGMSLGIVTFGRDPTQLMMQLLTMTLAFYTGYLFGRFGYFSKYGRWALTFLAVIYVTVCLIAISGFAPGIFPIEEALWSDGSTVQSRPAITTDQNFQVLYLLPALYLVSEARSLFGRVFGLAIFAGAVFILMTIQSRSGVLSWALSSLFLFYCYVRPRILDVKRLAFLALVIGGAIIFFQIYLSDAFNLLVIRNDMATLGGSDRASAYEYFFSVIFDPRYWLPQGYDDFLSRYHLPDNYTPHSNFTAIMLEGGALAVVGYIAILIRSVGGVLYRARYKHREFSSALALVLPPVLIQLVLNIPLHDQLWLWLGFGIGVASMGITTGDLGAGAVRGVDK